MYSTIWPNVKLFQLQVSGCISTNRPVARLGFGLWHFPIPGILPLAIPFRWSDTGPFSGRWRLSDIVWLSTIRGTQNDVAFSLCPCKMHWYMVLLSPLLYTSTDSFRCSPAYAFEFRAIPALASSRFLSSYHSSFLNSFRLRLEINMQWNTRFK